MTRTVVLIPAYNEEKTIAKIVVGAKKYAETVIVCDDGSRDATGEIAHELGVEVIRHEKNLGKGAALKDLVEQAKKLNPVVVLTIDADSQHDPSDIPRVAEPILRGEADIVLGTRMMTKGSAPRERVLGNMVLDAMTSAKAGDSFRDTQSGFRAYSTRALERLTFEQRGMAVESQTLIDAARAGLRIAEVPVSVKYDGILQKRSPLKHLSEVVDYVLTRTIVDGPLLYLGLPGLIAIMVGLGAGVQVVNVFSATRMIAVGTALIAVALVIVGTVMLATSFILKLIRAQARR